MHNADQLAEMEKAMREEHQKDVEALQRLKRFLPSSGHSKAVEKVEAISQKPINHQDNPAELDEVDSAPSTIIQKVESVMIADTERKWTVPLMLGQLRKEKFPLAAQKPISTLGLVFAKLHRRGKIRLVRRGGGRVPNVFRGIAQPEGDSEISQKSERATQGQPEHVH